MSLITKQRRLGGLDLLRAAAIISVVLTHYQLERPTPFPFLRYGWVGVDLFFVLSGYLIGGQLLSLQLKRGSIPFRTFYLRRFMRTLPSYYVALALYVMIPALNPVLGVKPNLVVLAYYLTFTQNLALMMPYFQISWSLCIEEHFYLLLPLVILFLRRWNRRIILLVFLVVFLSQLLIRCAIIGYGMENHALTTEAEILSWLSRVYYPTYCRLDGLTVGVGLAALQLHQPQIWSKLMGLGNKLLVAAVVTLALTFWLISTKYYLITGTAGFTMLSISFGLFTAAALSPGSYLHRINWRPVRLTAELAYSIYLTHPIAFYLTGMLLARFGLDAHAGGTFIALMLGVLLLAMALYLIVERPCLKLRDRVFFYRLAEPGSELTTAAESR